MLLGKCYQENSFDFTDHLEGSHTIGGEPLLQKEQVGEKEGRKNASSAVLPPALIHPLCNALEGKDEEKAKKAFSIL